MTLQLIATARDQGARLGAACEVAGISARTHERWTGTQGQADGRTTAERPAPARKLSEEERARVIAIATSEEFRDLSPGQIVPTLADRQEYVCSESTMCRVLRAARLVRHREPSRPPCERPRTLVARGPREVWAWDITYLRGPVKGTFFYLYLVVDLYSRKIVGAAVHLEESGEHAAALLEAACRAENVAPGQLSLHSDNGSPMKASTMLAKLRELGVAASFSRPAVSDDNPFPEALFRTLKYRPEFPRRPFRSADEARSWVSRFVRWYNEVHLHSALRFVTPATRHAGRDAGLLAGRQAVYEAARAAHPERWTGSTRNWTPVGPVVLNPSPAETREAKSRAS
jgi:transposase InsO family protein